MNLDKASVVAEVIHSRRSVRHFSDRRVEDDLLNELVRAGVAAPSGSNWQNQRFLVVSDPEEIHRIGVARFVWPYKNANAEKIRQIHPAGIVGNASALIIVFSDSRENDRRGTGEYYLWQNLEIQNCAASIENILLLATSKGIATCWISASDDMNYTRMFNRQSWRNLLADYEIPIWYKLQGIVMVGYPKNLTEDGYPKGESMHGATVWQSTERRPVEYYLIGKRSGGSAVQSIARADKWLVKLLSHVIRVLLRCVRFCDKQIHRIEIDKYLKRDPANAAKK